MVAFAPDDGRALLQTLLPPGLLWTCQQGSDLGERMAGALADAHAQGFEPLVVVGTDSPTLPPRFVSEALAVLSAGAAEVVLGPTEDGGYYLVGTNTPTPGLFDGVAWSTSRTYADTAGNADRLGLRRHILPPWYDIDTPDDLARLRRAWETRDAAGWYAPATALWLRAHPPVSLSREAAHPQTTV